MNFYVFLAVDVLFICIYEPTNFVEVVLDLVAVRVWRYYINVLSWWVIIGFTLCVSFLSYWLEICSEFIIFILVNE